MNSEHNHDLPNLPRIAIIAAMTSDRLIGTRGQLPWHLPEDLQLFKRLTTGSTVLMGRGTYESIGRPLPDRHNIVLSRSLDNLPGIEVCSSFMDALKAATRQKRPVFVIGGKEVYSKALQVAVELHISWVKGDFDGDILFPKFNFDEWQIAHKEDFSDFHYIHYHRRQVL